MFQGTPLAQNAHHAAELENQRLRAISSFMISLVPA